MNGPIRTDEVRAAIAEFPELVHLADMVADGWLFLPIVTGGEVTLVCGVRTWPNHWADAIGIRSSTDAQGVRADPDGHLVWKREGRMAEVVHALRDLPAPETRTAPAW